MHAAFAISAAALAVCTVWMIAADSRRQWRGQQQQFFAPPENATGANGRRESVFLSEPGEVVSIDLPGLPLRWGRWQVDRVDRCVTCHLGIVAPPEIGIAERAARIAQPQPFALHPRVDLFAADDAPHPWMRFGCTVCHEGRGPALSFVRAAHQPNSPAEAAAWRERFGWRDDPHWPRPMLPRRLSAARCASCHVDLLDLDRGWLDGGESARDALAAALSPDGKKEGPGPRPQIVRSASPAAEVLEGLRLVRHFGCFGCHEIDGRNTQGGRIGPSLLLETRTPDRAGQRKIGPALGNAGERLAPEWIRAQLADPRRHQPQGRMPRLFGLHEHLSPAGRAAARELEDLEIRAITQWLLQDRRPPQSQSRAAQESPVQEIAAHGSAAQKTAEKEKGGKEQGEQGRAEPRAGVPTPAAAPGADAALAERLLAFERRQVERGRELFIESGCAACHRHTEFPTANADVGPDLSRVEEKYQSSEAAAWLRRWLRDPQAINPRTAMPQVWWDRTTAGTQAESDDPVEDLARFLLVPRADEGAAAGTADRTLAHEPVAAPRGYVPLSEDELRRLSAWYGPSGGRPARADGLVDVEELAQRVIARRGCNGCHDLPGGERPPIGPPLTGWAVKPIEQLAFEDAAAWLDRNPPSDADDPDGFYAEAVRRGRREGFAWQKLGAPRSFDYRPRAWSMDNAGAGPRPTSPGPSTANSDARNAAVDKPPREQLLMGQFPLTGGQRAAITAFLMSLTDDPRPADYLAFGGRAARELRGRELFETLACDRCHLIEPQRWLIEYRPDETPPAPAADQWPFVLEMMDSRSSRGGDRAARRAERSAAALNPQWRRAVVEGMARVDRQGRILEDEDDEGRPLIFVAPWQPLRLGEAFYPVGGAELPLRRDGIVGEQPAWGGAFSAVLYPQLLAAAQRRGENLATEQEAFGWGPPPLVHARQSLRRGWTAGFLARPTTVRPAAVLRMPRYALRPDEIDALAAYLTDETDPAEEADGAPAAFDERAWALITDRTTFCAKCHVINDLRPSGESRSVLAPDLTLAARRLRGPFFRRWLASPKSVLPYTAMPVNFPPSGEPLGQDLFPAVSREQLDAVADLLLHYDEYARRQTSAAKQSESHHEKAPSPPSAP